jgi:hypothetical protein
MFSQGEELFGFEEVSWLWLLQFQRKKSPTPNKHQIQILFFIKKEVQSQK